MARDPVMSSYWRGLRDTAPFIVVLIPFGMLFGILATEAGLSIFETLTFSVTVIAGAAQFAALQLLAEDAPAIIALLSALAVNLRMAMYSAALTPHLGGLPLWQRACVAYLVLDQVYAQAVLEYERRQMSTAEKGAYFFGSATALCPMWYVSTLLGAWLGEGIPPEWGIDFALPLAFIAITAPMLRSPAHVAAALSSVVLALVFNWVPFNLGLMIAGIGGMMVGARVELLQRVQP